MITLRKMDNTSITINPDFILSIEENPDTLITLSNGRKLIVKESRNDIVDLFIQLKRQILRN